MDAESSQATALVRKRRKFHNPAADPSSSAGEPKRIPVPKGRRKAGLLASLPSMPLDILFEILGQLKPYDVLKLARTTKDFRRLLMNRSSLSIWKAALSNIPGLPDCPPGMSEPAWTNLVFSPQCNFCLTTSIRKVQWVFRIRICSKCAKEYLGESRDVFYSSETYRSKIESFIPTSPGKRGTTIFLKSDRKLVEEQYAALASTEAQQLFAEERKNAVLAIKLHAKLCETWAAGQSIDRDQQLQQLRENRLAAIMQKLEDLGWAEELTAISLPDSIANHKLVDRPQLLTERIWTNIKPGILEFMAEMRNKRFKREFAALVNRRKGSALDVLRTFKNARLPETEIMPQGPDFCHFSVVSEVLNQAADVEVDVSSFNDIILRLPELIVEWRESIKRKMVQVVKMHNNRRSRGFFSLLDLIPEFIDEDEPPNIDLNSHLTDEELSRKLTLASTVFNCSCSDSYDEFPSYDSDDEDYLSPSPMLFYPQVMGHSCLTRVSNMYPWDPVTSDPSRLFGSYGTERQQWDGSSLSLHPNAGGIARHIIQSAGLDPDLATSHEMDQLKIRFGCSVCIFAVSPEGKEENDDEIDNNEELDSVFPIFDWRGAISHQTNRHPNAALDSTLLMLNEESFAANVKETESEHWADVDCIWSCTHCRDLPVERRADTLDSVKKHISRMHQIESPILNEDYFKHFAALDMRDHDGSYFRVRTNGAQAFFTPYKSP